MIKTQSLRSRVAIAGAIAILTAGAGVYASASMLLGDDFATRVKDALVSGLEASLGRDVQIGSVEPSLSGRIVVRDLRIANGPGARSGVLLSVSKVDLWISVLELLRQRSEPLRSVKRIEVDGARASLVQGADGAWNIGDILAGEAGSDSRAVGAEVVVTNSTLLLDAGRGLGASWPHPTREDISLSRVALSSSKEGKRSFEGTCGAVSLGRAQVSVQGTYAARDKALSMEGSVVRLGLPAIMSRLPRALARFSADSGELDADFTVSMAASTGLSIKGTARPKDVSFSYDKVPLAKATGVSGEIEFTEDSLRLKSVSLKSAGGAWNVSGTVKGLREPVLDLQCRATGVDLSTADQVSDNLGGATLSGDASGALSIRGSWLSPRAYGAVRVARGTIREPKRGQSLEDIAGDFEFSGETVSFQNVACRFGDARGLASGEVEGLKTPSFDTEVVFDDFDASVLSVLVKGFAKARIAGRGRHSISLQGTPRSYFASGQVSIPQGSIWGIGVTDVEAAYEWTGKRFDLADLTTRAFGGALAVKGSTVWAPQGYTSVYALEVPKDSPMRAELISRHLSKAGLQGVDVVSGAAVGQGVWTSSPSEEGFLLGQATVSGGTLLGHTCSSVASDLSYRQGVLSVERASATGGGADEGLRVQARGTVTVPASAGAMDLAFSATGVEASKALPSKADMLSGRFDMDGRISGTVPNWTLSGDVRGGRGNLAGLAVDAFSGNVALTPGSVEVSSLSLRRGMSTYLLTGRSRIGRKPHVTGYIDARDGTLDDILTTARKLGLLPAGWAKSVSTTLNGTGRVTGQLSLDYSDSLKALGGKIDVSDMVVEGEPLKAGAEFVTDSGTVTVSRLNLEGKTLSASVSGTFAAEAGTAELGIEATMIPARLVERVLGRRLGFGGDVNFAGRLTGPLSAPDVEGTVRVGNGSWKGLRFDDTSARVSWYGDHLAVTDAVANIGESQYRASGNVTLGRGAPQIDLKGSLKGARVSHMARLFPALEHLALEGSAVAEFALSGSLASPEGSVTGELTGLSCRGTSLGSGRLSIGVKDRSIRVDKLELRQGSGLIQAGGIVDQRGQVGLDIQVKDYQVGDLAALAGLDLKTTLNLACQVTGPYADPSISASLSTNSGLIKGIAFSGLTGTFSLEEGLVLLQSASLTSGKAVVSATGRVPLFAGAKSLSEVLKTLGSRGTGGIGDAEGVDVVVTLSKGGLGLLPLLTDMVESASGGDEIAVRVGGTLRKPSLVGQGRLTNGKMQLKYVSGGFDRVMADIGFVENSLVMRNLAATGTGGVVTGSARVSLGRGGYGLSAQASLTDLKLSAPFPGRLDGIVSLARSPGEQLRIDSTKLVLSKCLLSVPIALVTKKADSTPRGEGIDPLLGLRIYVGNEVRLKQPSLADVELAVGDSMDLGGTFKHPTFQGRLSAHRGSFIYLGTTFKLSEANVELGKAPPEGDAGPQGLVAGLSINGDVKGETTTKGTTIFLTLSTDGTGILTDLRSSPPMEEREIRSLLSWPSRVQGLGDGGLEEGITQEVQSLLVDQVRQYFVGGVEDAFKSALGLDEFRLEQSVDEGYRVSLGKYVNDRVFVTYTNGLSADPLRNLRIDYTLKPGVYLSAQVDSRRDYRVLMDTRFRF